MCGLHVCPHIHGFIDTCECGNVDAHVYAYVWRPKVCVGGGLPQLFSLLKEFKIKFTYLYVYVPVCIYV